MSDILDTAYSYYPILGWRSWGVVIGHKSYVLQGRWHGAWPSHLMKAAHQCPNPSTGLYRQREANDLAETCPCGIYAYKDFDRTHYTRALTNSLTMYGLVALTDVIEHEDGYRGLYAQILAGFTPTTTLRRYLADAYSFPQLSSPSALQAAYRRYVDHPDKIPTPDWSEYGTDWTATAPHTTGNPPDPQPRTIARAIETEEEWRARTGWSHLPAWPATYHYP